MKMVGLPLLKNLFYRLAIESYIWHLLKRPNSLQEFGMYLLDLTVQAVAAGPAHLSGTS